MIDLTQFKDLFGYKLIHAGTLALARAEQAGLRIDVDYCEKTIKRLSNRVASLENDVYNSEIGQLWYKEFGRRNTNYNSDEQFRKILFDKLGYEPERYTDRGQPSVDEDALNKVDVEGVEELVKIRKLSKAKDTYLMNFVREQVDGVLHPFLNLHTVSTYRSCVAKGTKILVCRDFLEHPKGVPIEDVKVGDYVYCFDDALRPAVKKVLWSGKTGHREVIRVHWVAKGTGGKGYVDVTPEHKIRLIDGTYVPAEQLMGADFRKETDSPRLPKIRVLACRRVDDFLSFTGHLKNGKGIHEHRFIYENFISPLKKEDVIHHIDGNHYNHTLANLKKMTLEEHSRYHGLNVSDEEKERRLRVLNENRDKIVYFSGEDNANSLNLTKYQCWKTLAKMKGNVSKGTYDFAVFKKYLTKHNIDIKMTKLRYDREGKYISKKYLLSLVPLGISEVQKIVGLGYYSLQKLYAYYNIPFDRKWGNQFGEFKIGNHIITKVERLGDVVDVYDLEVEDYHNFFANEICVHNSGSSPNFQNIPNRDEEIRKIVRQAVYPRKGHKILAVDFSGSEVKHSCAYHKDPTLMNYVIDESTDMHRDTIMDIYSFDINTWHKLKELDTEEHKVSKPIRNEGKTFVFAEFYGDYYKQQAPRLWKVSEKLKYLNDQTVRQHLKSVGLGTYESFEEHVRKAEDIMWNQRFKKYNKWRNDFWDEYCKRGWFTTLTGFKCQGEMTRNEVTNSPIQGSAFHSLLLAFIMEDCIFTKHKLDSKLVFQIHDEVLIDVHPAEEDFVAESIKWCMTEAVPQIYKFINVPLKVEADITPVDGSWYTKKGYEFKN